MRLHFGFITGVGGVLGTLYYEYLYNVTVPLYLKAIIYTFTFIGYGINQVINDYTGIEEDRINAPNRPMVSGKLNPKAALIVSIALNLFLGVSSLIIAPISLVPVVAGVLLNFIYEYAKSIPVIGNLFFGLSMMSCPVYGFLLCGDYTLELPMIGISAVIFILSYTTGLMTYFTYFKDYEGDKEAGKKTYIVQFGIEHSRKMGIVFSLVPALLVLMCHAVGIFDLSGMEWEFWFLVLTTFILEMWTAYLYFETPTGDKTFFNQRNNIQACVASIIVPIAIFNGTAALILLSITYILIELIFNFHKDAKC